MKTIMLEGFISIKSAIKAKNRDVFHVYISNKKRTRKTSYMKKLCESESIPYSFVPVHDIEEKTVGNTHGGFVAEVGMRRTIPLTKFLTSNKYMYIVGVEDPYNLASIIRTAYASGIAGVLLDERDWSFAETILSRGSAGTFESIDLTYVQPADLQYIKDQGYEIVLIDQNEQAVDLYDANIPEKCIVVIGGEKRGIPKEISLFGDKIVYIPYARDFGYSLPATIAATVVSFELFRRQNG